MAEDKPNNPNPNIQKPSIPPNNKQKDKGLTELSKKMDELKSETKETKKSAEKNTEKIIKALEKNAKDTKPKKKSAEEKAEEDKNNKKFLDKLSGMFEGIKKGLVGDGKDSKGLLKPLFMMFTFFKMIGKLALVLGIGAIVSLIKFEDMKRLVEGFKTLFVKTKEFFTPIIQTVKKYLIETGLPSTVTLLLSSFDDVGILFEDLKKRFKGFTTSDWGDRTLMLLGSIKDIGDFVVNFGKSLVNYMGDLFGLDPKKGGKLSDRIRKWFDTTFSPEFTDNVLNVMGVLVGAMTVLNIFGMPRMMFLKGVGKMLLTPIKALYRIVALGLSPIGVGITLAALTVAFTEDIVKMLNKFTGVMGYGIHNMLASMANAAAESVGLDWRMDKKVWTMEDYATRRRDELTQEKTQWEANMQGRKDFLEMENLSGERGEAEMAQAAVRYNKKMGIWDTEDALSTGDFESRFDKTGWDRSAGILKGINEKLATHERLYADELGLDRDKMDIKDVDAVYRGILQAREITKGYVEAGIGVIKENDFFKSTAHIMDNEGFEPFAYDDRRHGGGMGKSIGYGFNLDKQGAADLLVQAGITATLEELMTGKKKITKAEAQRLMDIELPKFKKAAKKWYERGGPQLWSELAINQREALTDMAYNMGGKFTGKDQWPLLKAALIADNDAAMDKEMRGTPYWLQTGGRAARNLLDLQMPQNQSATLTSTNALRNPNGQTFIIHKEGDKFDSGDNNLIASKHGSAHGNNGMRDVLNSKISFGLGTF